MGDLIQSLPLLSDLAASGAGTRVLLVRPGVEEAARSLGLSEEVRSWPPFGDLSKESSLSARISLGRDFVGALRSEGFGQVLVLNHHGTGVVLGQLLGGRVSGFSRLFDREGEEPGKSVLLGWPGYLVASSRGVRSINRIHLSDMWRGFAGDPPGEGAPDSLYGPARTNPGGPVVVVLGGRSPYRRWDKAPLARLVRTLRQRDGGPVILSGGAEDRDLGEELVRECGAGVENTAGMTSVSELARLLSGAGVVVSPDTASLHLAAALGVPTVGLFFASALPFETGAYRTGALSVVSSMDCYPCNGEGSACAHLSCRTHPEPESLAEIVLLARRGAGAIEIADRLAGRLSGTELWEGTRDRDGLVQRVRSPRFLTRDRLLARLLRRFFLRYLAEANPMPDLEEELGWEGTGGLLETGAQDGFSGNFELWCARLERGIALYGALRERKTGRDEKSRIVVRLSQDFPMIWPVLHCLEGVEGGTGPLVRLARAGGELAREVRLAARFLRKSRIVVGSGREGGVHVGV